MKKLLSTVLLLSLMMMMCTGIAFAGYATEDMELYADNTSENRRTIVLELPYIPWEMPWLNGDVPSVGETRVIPKSNNNLELEIYNDGQEIVVSYTEEPQLIRLEVPVVSSTDDVPFTPGKRTVVSDRTLIYVIYDEINIASGGRVFASRTISVFGTHNPRVFYGDIWIRADGVFGGGLVSIASWDAVVILHTRPAYSNLEILSRSISNNPSSLVTISTTWRVSTTNGGQLASGGSLRIDGNGNFW